MARASRQWTMTAAWLLIAVVTTACGRDASGPAEPAIMPQQTVGSMVGWSAPDEDALRRLFEQERRRIDWMREESEAAHDSLKDLWDEYQRHDYPEDDSPLLMCQPQDYRAETKIIGPEGGDLSMGPHRLYIPRGALSQPTVVTAEAPSSLNVEVQFSPHGLQFRTEPKLTLSYRHCDRPAGFQPVMVYIDDAGTILEWLRGVNQPRVGEFNARISHFSKYAMATN